MDDTDGSDRHDSPCEPGSDSKGVHPRSAAGRANHTPEPPEPAAAQLRNERSRVGVDGTRTDDGDRCTLVVIHEVGGTWALYPHGWDTFGVRLSKSEAVKAAQAILHGAQ